MIDVDWRQVCSQIALYFGAGLIAVVCGFPLLWMVLTSVRPDRDILSPAPKFWSVEYHWNHYRNLFELTDFHIYFFNSITVAGTATLLTILVATLAAYGITRFRFGGRETIAGGMLFTYMFAPILIIVPFYILMRSAGLVNCKSEAFCTHSFQKPQLKSHDSMVHNTQHGAQHTAQNNGY